MHYLIPAGWNGNYESSFVCFSSQCALFQDKIFLFFPPLQWAEETSNEAKRQHKREVQRRRSFTRQFGKVTVSPKDFPAFIPQTLKNIQGILCQTYAK